ncbi:MAG: N-acetylglutaminylglutamine synthetase [Pseudomonadota bacterium]
MQKSERGRARPGHHRLEKLRRQSLKPVPEAKADSAPAHRNVVVECGWGRLIFAHTFDSMAEVAERLRGERPLQRDIAFYVREPHVALAKAPQELFLDPSHTFRLHLHGYRPARRRFSGFTVRRLCNAEDAQAVNRIYQARVMVPVDPTFYWHRTDGHVLTHFVAEDAVNGEILGTVMGVDHSRAFDDPEKGASLWCLAVDPQAPHAGIGEALVRRLIEHFIARGAAYLDLSVLHDNAQAIALYEKLGFERVPFFTLKNKNAINEKLFAGPAFDAELNPYAMIIIDEARRRGIAVEVLDAEAGYFRLSYGGRAIICRESLTELTSAIAMSRCADKAVTRRILGKAGLFVPAQISADPTSDVKAFLARHGSVVVKPANGEQGRGIAVDLRDIEDIKAAIDRARRVDPSVLIEQFVAGEDLRIIVIDFKVVAAAVRRPPVIIGDGRTSIRRLIEKQSRRRAAATKGESQIPLDEETARCLAQAGYGFDAVLEKGVELKVRKTANLHTGGTIHDVTDRLHPHLVEAAVKAARALDILVVGLDFIVPDASAADYVIIEANERPGLANHEPQPTAERFIDLIFPHSLPAELKG